MNFWWQCEFNYIYSSPWSVFKHGWLWVGCWVTRAAGRPCPSWPGRAGWAEPVLCFADAPFGGTPPGYAFDAERAEEQRRHHDMMPYIDDSPSSSPHLSSKSRGSRDTLSSGSLESTKSVSLCCLPALSKALELCKGGRPEQGTDGDCQRCGTSPT